MKSSKIVLFLFFCSGAAALVYEVVWSKYLGLIFGSTIQAQTVVLAVFMGGLALGNRLFGAKADGLREPLAVYGYLEVTLGLYAFFFPQLYAAADAVFVVVGSPLLERSGFLLLVKGLLSAALLLGPTILMGGTLPLLASWLRTASSEPGRYSARFYAVNSLGAVFGAWLAGFLLVRTLGLVSTLQMTALLNVAVGITAVGIARRSQEVPARQEKAVSNAIAAVPWSRSQLLWASGLVAGTGAISMGLEVLAARSLTLIFGASLQAFAVVLIAFILGIGAGSMAISSPRAARFAKPGASIACLLYGAFFVAAFVVGIEEWTIFYSIARTGLAATPIGYVYHQILIGLIAIVVLGIPAAMFGSILPLWIRLASSSTGALGNCVGRLLTWNTAGAVFGTLLAGFVVMPVFGLRNALICFAILASALAGGTAWFHQQRRAAAFSALFSGVLLWIAASGADGWRHVLSSGVFRLRAQEVTWNLMEQRRDQIDILFYEDGADATISIETRTEKNPENEVVLRVNGKPDASTVGDLSTQYLLAHLPMIAKPDSKSVFVLGFGSGITAGALLGYPVEEIVIAENCRPVMKASEHFEPWNRRVLHDSRTRVYPEDGRTVLKLSPRIFDVIISEPSNPWMAGVANVFSQEFYSLAAKSLADDGIMAQWFHIYEMHDGIVSLVLRTFASVFPYVEIWDSQEGDVILLGSQRPWDSSPSAIAQVYDLESPREDLEKIGLDTPEIVLARRVASQLTASAIPGDGAIQSDGFPFLDFAAPQAFFIGAIAQDLFRFDERTWQSVFVPTPIREALASRAGTLMEQTFSYYTLGNRELWNYLTWRKDSVTADGTHPVYAVSPYLISVFRPPDSFPSVAEIPPNATVEATRLLEAQTQLLTQPGDWERAVLTIETELRNLTSKTNQTVTLDWLPGHFAGIACRARFAAGDLDGARRVLELGLKAHPEDPQLSYLRRVLSKFPP